MSGKRAAAALMQFDCDLAREIEELNARDLPLNTDETEAFARSLYGKWTVSLAAAAAGVTEEVTVSALLYNHMRAGTNLVCQCIARSAMGN